MSENLTREPIAPMPQAKEERIQDPQPKDFSPEAMPPSLYVESGREPYISELMEAGDAYKQFDVKDKMMSIDGYINGEIERQTKENTKESYLEVFEDMVKKSGIAGKDIYSATDTLAEWVGIRSKLLNAVKEKEEFEKKSPLDMNVKELWRYISGK